MELTKKKLYNLIKESYEETEEERQLRLMSNFATALVNSSDIDGIRHIAQIGEQVVIKFSSLFF